MVFMVKLKKNWLEYFILLLPIIDFITSIFTWSGSSFSLGLILKGLFMGYACFYLFFYVKDRKIFLFLGLYGMVYFSYLLIQHFSLSSEIINLIKIFYLPILILFFSHYENSSITKKTLMFACLLYLILYIVPFFFGLGHNISEIYPNKELYLSYFYIGNELSNVIILLTPVVLLYLLESHSYLLQGIFILCYIILLLLMSTKTFYGCLFIIIIYFLVTKRKTIIAFVKKNQFKVLLAVAVFLLALVVYIPRADLTQNIKTSLEHYEVDKMSDLFTYENIDHVIFSNRLSFLENVYHNYKDSSLQEKMFGIGRAKINEIKNVEIDIFDIFYSIGIVGMIFYSLFFFYALKNSQLKGVYKFTFILLLIVSCFTGHVLISPFTSTFLALLALVSKNDKEKMKKDILFVSNMYPSKAFPHYGIFVKNSYELLKESGYSIDLVVMYKTEGKINKLFAYIKMCGISLLKAIFSNYDFIYVHFVSHTTAGVIVPYLCSRNTKLVINVHGNDIVADTEVDKSYLRLSKFFLKFASLVIAPSKYFASILKKEYNISKEKIVIYPSGGVDVDKFKKIDKSSAKKKAKLDENKNYFGYVARLEKDKGYDTLLEAIHSLKEKKKVKDIKFLIVGSGEEEPIFNEWVKKYKLQEYIEKRPLVSQEELVAIFNGIEALIYPTRRKSESLGLTGLEAMACECLVIGSNKYGPSDYLIDKENSFTFHPEDAEELVKKIEEFMKLTAKEKENLAKKARQKSEEYSFENTKDTLIKVFNNI